MDYQKLIGKTVKLNERDVLVEKIREIEGIHSNTYEVNDSYTYSTNAIFMAVIEVEVSERKNEVQGFFQKLLATFGIFIFSMYNPNEVRLGSPMGFRNYGHHKCSFFIEFHFGSKCRVIEFVFKDKNVYKDGIYPNGNINLKKIL